MCVPIWWAPPLRHSSQGYQHSHAAGQSHPLPSLTASSRKAPSCVLLTAPRSSPPLLRLPPSASLAAGLLQSRRPAMQRPRLQRPAPQGQQRLSPHPRRPSLRRPARSRQGLLRRKLLLRVPPGRALPRQVLPSWQPSPSRATRCRSNIRPHGRWSSSPGRTRPPCQARRPSTMPTATGRPPSTPGTLPTA